MNAPENPRPEYLDANNGYTPLYPVTLTTSDDGDRSGRIQLRRLTAKERLIADEPGTYTERLLRILESITGEPRGILLRLDVVDLDRLDTIFGYFTAPGPATGGNS